MNNLFNERSLFTEDDWIDELHDAYFANMDQGVKWLTEQYTEKWEKENKILADTINLILRRRNLDTQ